MGNHLKVMNPLLKQDEPAHLIEGEDCMGCPERYWRQFLFCSDGRVVCGTGGTADEASKTAKKLRDDHETFLTLPARQRVKEILSKYGPHTYPNANEQNELNKAFAELLGCL